MIIIIIFQQQLENLMNLLHSTRPHFVRCIIPNHEKKPGKKFYVFFGVRLNLTERSRQAEREREREREREG